MGVPTFFESVKPQKYDPTPASGSWAVTVPPPELMEAASAATRHSTRNRDNENNNNEDGYQHFVQYYRGCLDAEDDDSNESSDDEENKELEEAKKKAASEEDEEYQLGTHTIHRDAKVCITCHASLCANFSSLRQFFWTLCFEVWTHNGLFSSHVQVT